MLEIHTEEALQKLLNQTVEQPLFILKHSTRCSISAYALEQFNQFCKLHPETTCAMIDVIANRNVSNKLTELSKVPHASPQVIVYKNSQEVANASHWRLELENLEKILKQIK